MLSNYPPGVSDSDIERHFGTCDEEPIKCRECGEEFYPKKDETICPGCAEVIEPTPLDAKEKNA